ncbi:zinc finger RNA-binding protein isoform X2 [Folsomia candida]|uniref:Zinc finger RNA-binding protein 2 n=1 Tax=Folsomia candida TaxID=158441 RepID=A0A226F029_FOLCA|nr:zinc finger RNA-binding protein isoform X2 [Folsomia candida]OXA62818.1 Zinc finger RNA-binding protein 2 [Folsomia candida]
MATNNYYNFTHGGTYNPGTQYTASAGAATGAAYPPPSPYGTQQQATGQPYGTPTSDPYVIAGYTRPAGPGQQQQQQQQGYYNQAQAASYAASMGAVANKIARPTPPSTVYPTYSANTTGTTASASYAGFAPPQQHQPTQSNKFTNYDAAVYNAVSAYATGGPSVSRGNGMGFKKGTSKGMGMGGKPQRPMPKPQTLHYCDVCKISCAGPQTYKEHLDGQKHKKKEAAQKTGAPPVPKGGPAGLRCEVCDVTCTGSDAYAAHIRGAKHQKVVKLHTKLGKPIPSDSPTVIAAPTTNHVNSYNKSAISGNAVPTNTGNNNFAKSSAPKISFVGNVKSEPPVPGITETTKTNQPPPAALPMSTTYTSPAAPGGGSNKPLATNIDAVDKSSILDYIEKDIQPVGQDYIEEIRSEEGKVVSFNCKLCECRFNDPNAKEMHMKGRRHRLQYKKKVNPDLVVDVKPSSRQKKIDERRTARTISMRKPMSNDMGPVPLMTSTPRGFGPGYGGGPSPFYIPPLLRRPETSEDRHVMAKHAEIYPEEPELQAIQKIVSNTEKALKFVSDRFAEEDCTTVKTENGGEAPQLSEADLQAARKLKGVMRVGNLAKGLLLRGDREVELVVLCSEKPNLSMLNRVFDCLPKQMEIVTTEEKYDIRIAPEHAGIRISSTDDLKIDVIVTLTSPLLRNNSVGAPGEAQAATQVPELNDLPKEKCLTALAALRHAKWFQARATTLQSCVIVIRILRDMCRRVPQLHAMPCWAIELLTEKAISSPGIPISPGDALRIVFEILASGLMLQFGPGLLDPCEKESCDALAGLDSQVREDITAYAQQALRQISFRQIHHVLGMEAVPKSSKFAALGNRKRRRDPSGNNGDETDASNDLKKDKKEESVNILAAENVV